MVLGKISWEGVLTKFGSPVSLLGLWIVIGVVRGGIQIIGHYF